MNKKTKEVLLEEQIVMLQEIIAIQKQTISNLQETADTINDLFRNHFSPKDIHAEEVGKASLPSNK